MPCHGLLSNSEKDDTEELVGRYYIECWHDEVAKMRAILAEKTWFGFDLDDTLHEFRRASKAAAEAVLDAISQRHGTQIAELNEEYSKVLRVKTSNAFTDGKSSFDYRKERFVAVLERFSLPADEQFLSQLQQLYEDTLTKSLELKSGALPLISTIKRLGKKIVILTEGPEDAQERAIELLGLRPYVDFLATTNRFRVSKTSGLFPNVLRHLGIGPGDIAYVGDSHERDMMPAMQEGIFSIHFAETEQVALDASPPQINTLRKLQYMLSKE